MTPRIARAGALLALAVLTVLALAGPAGAKPRPHKDKRAESAKALPKQWAKRHHAKRPTADPDDDGLSNWGEYRSRTKPRKADTDKDGVGDAQEDYDRDGLDNGSEEEAGTDPGRRDTDRDGIPDGAEDPDGDGLDNAAEDRTGHDPRNADSDGDGIEDGDELAGTVQAFDGTTLTIALAAGGTATGVVDEFTEILCEDAAYYDDEDAWDDDDEGETFGVTARLAEEGEEDDAGDEEWDEELGDDCVVELVPGTPVHEAELEDGAFVAVDLLLED